MEIQTKLEGLKTSQQPLVLTQQELNDYITYQQSLDINEMDLSQVMGEETYYFKREPIVIQ